MASVIEAKRDWDKGGSVALLKDLATAVPIVHLLAAGIYLFGYGQGFDHQIIAFFGASDLFITSIRAVGQVYLYLAGPILLFLLLGKRARAGGAGQVVRLAAAVTAFSVIAIILWKQSWNFEARHITTLITLGGMVLLLVGLFFGLRIADARGVFAEGIRPPTLLTVVSLLFLFCLLLGINKGATDRHRSFESAEGGYFLCTREGQQRYVIRSIGSHYLTLSPQDRWSLVNGDCEVKFHLGAPPESAATSAHSSSAAASPSSPAAAPVN